MNILVIGNGFDLAHELPTGYIDFLKWTVGQYNFFYILKKQEAEITKSIGNISLKIPENVEEININQRVQHQEEIWNCIDNNVWIEYFLSIYIDRQEEGKDGWIDFECEVSEIIKSLNDDMKSSINQCLTLEDRIHRITHEFLKHKYINWPAKRTYRELRDTLLANLNKLVRAFEIYLTEYVEKIDVKVISPDIKDIAAILYNDRGKSGILFSKVISFNYTNIYEQIYLSKYNINSDDYVDYIHGEANINNTIETNNMVLGIDEYLGKKKRNEQVEFIAFKKYYQRIHKQTGCKYKEWVDKIRQEWDNETEESKAEIRKCISKGNLEKPKIHKLYIFGHSLDITDKDIFRDLILNDNVHTTIFYHNKDAMGQQIANLVKVIGQDELIKRTGGSTKTIEFVLQKAMEPIKD